MALCWGRNFRSFSSSAIFGRRASHSPSLYEKPGICPSLHQMTVREPYRTGGQEHISRLSTSCMFYTQERRAYKEVTSESDNLPGRPEKSQLRHVSKILAGDLPHIFTKTPNLSIYHPNIVLENNIRGTKTTGLMYFMLELAAVRILAYVKFHLVTLKLLKITEHVEDGTVRVRWRVEGLPVYAILIKPFTKSNTARTSWYDGFSTYYVHSDGLVHRLTLDKMMPDNDEKVSSSLKSELAAKMALAVSIVLKDFSVPSVCCQEVQEQLKYFYSSRVSRTFSQRLH